MSLLVAIAAAALAGQLLVPVSVPAEFLLGAALTAWGTAWSMAGRPPLAAALLLAGAAAASAAAPRLCPPLCATLPSSPASAAVGRVRWVRADGRTTLLGVEPVERAPLHLTAEPLAAAVRLRIDGPVALRPDDAVLLPARVARAAWAGPARDAPRDTPLVPLDPGELARLAVTPAAEPDWAEAARRHVERAVDARAGPAAAAIRSLALGEGWALPAADRDLFRTLGVSHLLAISGFNLALLAWLLGRSLTTLGPLVLPPWTARLDPRRLVAALVLPAVWAVTALVDWQPSVVRAALMISAMLAARLLGRRAPALDALAFTVVAVLLAAPAQAADPGFQLSVAAVGGLLCAMRASRLRRRPENHPAVGPFRRARSAAAEPTAAALEGRPTGRAARLATAASIAGRLVLSALGVACCAALATAPIGVWHFGQLAPAAPLANLLAVPLFTFAVYPAAVLTALVAAGPAPPWLVDACTAATTFAWDLFVHVCRGLARVLPGSVRVGSDGALGVTLVALACGLLLVPWRAGRRCAAVFLALVAVSPGDLSTALQSPPGRAPPRPPGAVEVVFLDVGDGDAALVTLPDGRHVLIDGGPAAGFPQRSGRRGQLAPQLARCDIDRLALVVLTHPHPDHFGGLLELADRVVIDELWTTPQAEIEAPVAPVARWLRRLESHGTRVRRTPGICGRRELGPLALEVLGPCGPRGFDPTLDENENSIVLRLSVGGTAVLFAGDAGHAAEERLLAQQVRLDAAVLKVAHHGSRTASGERFLAAVRPRFAVVSASLHRPDHRGPPHEEVLARLAEHGALVLQTGRVGALTLHIGPRSAQLYDGEGRERACWP